MKQQRKPTHPPAAPTMEAEAMAFASPETLPGILGALSDYETAAKERRDHAAQLTRESHQANAESAKIDHRIAELVAERDRLAALAADKQHAAEDRHAAAVAATAQAEDMRQILSRIAPDALQDYDERIRAQAATVAALAGANGSTTGPQDTRVAAGLQDTAAMPPVDSAARNGS